MLAGCGTSNPAGDPLISGSVQATYAGRAFTPTYGFATTYMNQGLIGLGDGPVHCGTEKSPIPPSGHGVIIDLPSLAVGTYDSALVQVFQTMGDFNATGSTGSVDVTEVTDASVAATVTFNFTDPQTNETFAANGTFEVVHCP